MAAEWETNRRYKSALVMGAFFQFGMILIAFLTVCKGMLQVRTPELGWSIRIFVGLQGFGYILALIWNKFHHGLTMPGSTAMGSASISVVACVIEAILFCAFFSKIALAAAISSAAATLVFVGIVVFGLCRQKKE